MKHITTLIGLCLVLPMSAQTTHEIHVVDNDFLPAITTMQIGDTIELFFDAPNHTFTQVSEDTWNANGDTPLPGGYEYGLGTSNPGLHFTIVPDSLGTIYFVCEYHALMGMKGQVIVTSAGVGIGEQGTLGPRYFSPNPANDVLLYVGEQPVPIEVEIYDGTGRLALLEAPSPNSTVNVSTLPEGSYVLQVRDREQKVLLRQTLVIAR